jgi:hypothetical protein
MITNLYTNQYTISNIPAGQVAIVGKWYFVKQSTFSMNSFSQTSFRMVDSILLSTYVYDYFNQADYLLASPGQISPNGQWSLLSTGGSSGTVTGVQNQQCEIQTQAPVVTPTETYVGQMVQTNPSPSPNHVIQIFVKVDIQLRSGSGGTPNVFEVAIISD